MGDYRIIEQQLSEVLHLQRRPVTVTFLQTPPAGTNSPDHDYLT
jgi:hypothetical protein